MPKKCRVRGTSKNTLREVKEGLEPRLRSPPWEEAEEPGAATPSAPEEEWEEAQSLGAVGAVGERKLSVRPPPSTVRAGTSGRRSLMVRSRSLMVREVGQPSMRKGEDP
eukprot:CAMPEP_0169428408 /NCGR_PEP_ID=MMETSP1042-20121227/1311_1 /TAXON_ID=464988 /ORGANISM="Hemiselmis andersenii, Strain CCMP1180" /LENGTH=108 /DNA_ID=CAMNT_0009538577 /DNA_START=415 /DNA_END=742 /DNA_ORIENTATION=+